MQDSRLLVVMPAYNEQAALPAVLAEVERTLPDVDVLVVSDGSTDDTAGVARRAGVTVLELPFNLGVGGAMRAGFKFARLHGYQQVVQLDADGQHDPAEVATLRQTRAERAADLVIGARFAGTGEYVQRGPRRWAMRLIAAILSSMLGTRLTDATSGFKLLGPRAIALFAEDYPAEYLGDTVEALVIAHRAGLRIEQVGVHMRPRATGRPSQSPAKAFVFLIRAVMAVFVALLRPGASDRRLQE